MSDDVKDILEKVSVDSDHKCEKVSDDAKDILEKVSSLSLLFGETKLMLFRVVTSWCNSPDSIETSPPFPGSTPMGAVLPPDTSFTPVA